MGVSIFWRPTEGGQDITPGNRSEVHEVLKSLGLYRTLSKKDTPFLAEVWRKGPEIYPALPTISTIISVIEEHGEIELDFGI